MFLKPFGFQWHEPSRKDNSFVMALENIDKGIIFDELILFVLILIIVFVQSFFWLNCVHQGQNYDFRLYLLNKSNLDRGINIGND